VEDVRFPVALPTNQRNTLIINKKHVALVLFLPKNCRKQKKNPLSQRIFPQL
jgi:hypothetical protein